MALPWAVIYIWTIPGKPRHSPTIIQYSIDVLIKTLGQEKESRY